MNKELKDNTSLSALKLWYRRPLICSITISCLVEFEVINGHSRPTRGCGNEACRGSHCSHHAGMVSHVPQQTSRLMLLAARGPVWPLCRCHPLPSRLPSSLSDWEEISVQNPAIRTFWVKFSHFITHDMFETEFCCRVVAYGGGQERRDFTEMWSKRTQKENGENIKMTVCWGGCLLEWL